MCILYSIAFTFKGCFYIHKLSILVEYTHMHTHTKLVILVFSEEKDGQPRAWGMRETDFLHCLNSVIMTMN